MSDELSLHDYSDTEFSGFSADEISKSPSAEVGTLCADSISELTSNTRPDKMGKKDKRGKTDSKSSSKSCKKSKDKTHSTASTSAAGKHDKPKKSSKSRGSTTSTAAEKDDNCLLDISRLSIQDLDKLRDALGLSQYFDKQPSYEQNDDVDMQADDLSRLPNLHVTVDCDEDSDNDVVLNYNSKSNVEPVNPSFGDALFDESENIDPWELPKLKAPVKGEAVNSNLAKLINTACSVSCDTDTLMSKYKIPENCECLGAPLVNMEIWKILDKRARSQDRGLAEIQNLLSLGMVPIMKLADILKTPLQKSPEAKSLMSDMLTLIGQVQFQLSLRRRYLIRPSLNKKYKNMCNVNTPISSNLFGDDISKEMKSCESGVNLGLRDMYRPRGFVQRPYRMRGRGAYQYGHDYQPAPRYHPYAPRGNMRPYMSRPYGNRGRRIPPTATVSSDQAKN